MWLPFLSLCRSLRLLSLAFRSFLLITSRVHRALYVRHVAGLTTLLHEKPRRAVEENDREREMVATLRVVSSSVARVFTLDPLTYYQINTSAH